MVSGLNVRTVSLGVDGDTFNLPNPLIDAELLRQLCSMNISDELISKLTIITLYTISIIIVNLICTFYSIGLVAETANSVVPVMLPNAALNLVANSRDSPYKAYNRNGGSKPIDASNCAYRSGLPPPLEQFIAFVSRCSRVRTGTLMCAVVLLERLRSRLPKEARGQTCTAHRLFIASLVIAGKCNCDCWPTNPHWASHRIGFSAAEISLMERQMLRLLDYSLAIDESHLVAVAVRFMPTNHPIHRSIAPLPLSPNLYICRAAVSPILNDVEQVHVAQMYTPIPSSSDNASKINEQAVPLDVYPPKHHLQVSSVKSSTDNSDRKHLSTMASISTDNSISSNQSYESDFPAHMLPDQKQRVRPHSYQFNNNAYKFFQRPGDNTLSNTLYPRQSETTAEQYQKQQEQQQQQSRQQSIASFPSGTNLLSYSSKNNFSAGVEGGVPKVTVINNTDNHLSRLLRRSNARSIGTVAGV